ncbi:MAG: hypothetical protein EZS28_003335 [Streblomastix strix]|uniref:EF-hand domain-containing protein n=1 Tax=Streblomastix strix TaxID=222440 RepID=A0A5J4X3S3_9EUKA|nr:MAG: hypothetical protein EZS28_003335 [Streblomastix strix]
MEEKAAAIDEEEEFQKMFRLFDVRRVGYATYSDVETVFKEHAPTVKADVIERMFTEVDRDGDGNISFLDFYRIMKLAHPSALQKS